MKGKIHIIVENRKIKYDFEIKRNLTIIKGDSATGKTTLVDMIAEHYQEGEDSGVHIQCEKECVILFGRNWKTMLTDYTDSIVFIDEGNPFIKSTEFAAAIQKTNNYYVIVTRENLPNLPYSVTEIYGIRNSGKYGSLKKVYNEMYHIYGKDSFMTGVKPELIITEDGESGFQFFKAYSEKQETNCISANGKSNIFGKVKESEKEQKMLVIADGAAFGSEIERVLSLTDTFENLYLYLPESFEWLILNADLLKNADVKQILERPYDYIESEEYMSWERYFTSLLVEMTKGTHFAYSKKILNPVYCTGNNMDKILGEWKDSNLT